MRNGPLVPAACPDLDFLALLTQQVPDDALEHLLRQYQIRCAGRCAAPLIFDGRLRLEVLIGDEDRSVPVDCVEVLHRIPRPQSASDTQLQHHITAPEPLR